MLNRRILRIKAFKAVYCIAENPLVSQKEILSQLESSCESTRNLYLFLLGLVKPLTSEAYSRIDALRNKFNPTEEERHPNLKFTTNLLAPLIDEDPDFSKIFSKKKLSWEQYDVFLRHLYEDVRESGFFKEYMASSKENSIREDAELFSKIFAAFLPDNKELSEILEDISIWWNDDLEYAINFCCSTFDDLGKGRRWSLPELYMSELIAKEGMASDRKFVKDIVIEALNHYEKYFDAIAELTPKWDKSRICATDLALIVSGMAEAAAYPNTPAKVIMNEYVEISKYYSTPESSSFVNGLLNKLINKQSNL